VNSPLREFAKWIVPYHVWNRLRQKRLDAGRARQLSATLSSAKADEYTCAAAIDFLVSLGCDHAQVVAGSMPQMSLDYARTFLPADARRGLHVGNFVGVSLAYFIHALGGASVVVAVDPNIVHRGIANPASRVLALLEHFELENNCLLLTGYSLERSVANDGRDYAGGFATTEAFATEPSCAQVLPQLTRLAPATFDFAVMDGNHDGIYLRRELACIVTLLRPGGVLVLDDVSSEWFEIERVYEEIGSELFEKLGTDGRVGVLRKRIAN
jgi:SAM-dependent methyltransferase